MSRFAPPFATRRNWKRPPRPEPEQVEELVEEDQPKDVEEALAKAKAEAESQDPPVETEPVETEPVETEPVEAESAKEEDPSEEEDEDKPEWYKSWDKPELLEVAERRGLDVTDENTKDEIIDALEASDPSEE